MWVTVRRTLGSVCLCGCHAPSGATRSKCQPYVSPVPPQSACAFSPWNYFIINDFPLISSSYYGQDITSICFPKNMCEGMCDHLGIPFQLGNRGTKYLQCCCLVAKSCPTLFGPVDSSPPVSSVLGISQARILEWVAISFCRGSSWPRIQMFVSCTGRRILYLWAAREALRYLQNICLLKGAWVCRVCQLPLKGPPLHNLITHSFSHKQ